MKFSKLNEVKLEDTKIDGKNKSLRKSQENDHDEWQHGIFQAMSRIVQPTNRLRIINQFDTIEKLENLIPSEYSSIRSKIASLASKQRQINNIKRQARIEAQLIIDELKSKSKKEVKI